MAGSGGRSTTRRRRGVPRDPSGSERLLVGIVAAALPVYLAIEGGGYDLILRQELGVAIWWFLALAFAFGALPRARPAGEQRLAAVALAALVAWTALAMLGTESQGRTFEELGRVITYAGIFVLAWAAIGPRTWRDAATGLTVAAVAVPVIAVASRLVPELFESVALAQILEGRRLAYPLGYWNAVAAWCAMAFCLALAWSAHGRHTLTREAMLAALPAAGVALYLTYSRAGSIALLIGIAAVVVASRDRITAMVHAGVGLAATALVVLVVRSQPEIAEGTGGDGGWLVALALAAVALTCSQAARLTRRAQLDRPRLPIPHGPVAAAAAAAILVAAAVAVGPSVGVRAGDEFAAGGRPELHDDPAARLVSLEGTRSEIWASALRAFGSEPASGIGPGTFQFWWERDVADGESLRDAHSLYLETLAELGVPGILALLALLGALFLGVLRARRAAASGSDVAATSGLLGAYLVFVFHAGVDWLWDFPALIALGVGAGLVAGAARASGVSRRSRLTGPRLALVGLAVVAGAIEIPALVSKSSARSAESALALGRTERATELADEAIRAQPWAADPYALRAFIALSDDRPAAARADIDAAIVREPTNWRHRLLLVRAEAKLGHAEAALAAVDEAQRLRPGLASELAAIRRAIRSGDLTVP